MAEQKNPTKSFFLLKKTSEPEIGFTTGTCAAAASLAATRMLLTQKNVSYVTLLTPKGIKVFLEIENQSFTKNSATCSVKKFSGTDPDVTNGIEVFSTVRKITDNQIVTNFQRDDISNQISKQNKSLQQAAGSVDEIPIKITGGKGVGKVTLPGLDQKPGASAINSVPRRMILDGVKREIGFFLEQNGEICDFKKVFPGLEVEISVPGGEEIAKQTFNPKLGIVGGISILGTSGIVEPMSEQALLDTIQVEINVRKAQGFEVLPVVPGNYGADFLQSEFGFSVETAVHSSNFVYDSLLMAKNSGFKKLLFCGHLGKLVKVAGGIKNTHSKYGDHRMEIISQVAEDFIPKEQLSSIKKELSACISTEQAVKILDSLDECQEIRNKIMAEITRRIQKNMIEWTEGGLEIEVIVFTKEQGLLGESQGARNFCSKIWREI
ncbi:cobalt-precorrin-5B (C(1))-methyltransferase CbiD [Treponema ruminis]|uniref:Cobalt-precorrin-5B C(1)-methyltransferase n=1 Tax=Treponema ruminis TaxID=744515 RepID=A0A7W8GB29_9SPIR|nr:cobalt-precorrin-5B (C(1))-methyltransferase CbiD [Treponema ruminis]MBB5227167.1 cobalt-precorrin-5B (C1)-methyltransferase [Treponema ruminis]